MGLDSALNLAKGIAAIASNAIINANHCTNFAKDSCLIQEAISDEKLKEIRTKTILVEKIEIKLVLYTFFLSSFNSEYLK